MFADPQATKARPPWHFWVLGIVALLWNAMGAFDYVMTETRNEEYLAEFTQAQLDFFDGLPPWVIATWAIAVWGGLVGTLLLLLRKRLALTVFGISLVAMLTTTFHSYVLSNGLEVMGDAFALSFRAVIFLVSLALVFYARALCRSGVLR